METPFHLTTSPAPLHLLPQVPNLNRPRVTSPSPPPNPSGLEPSRRRRRSGRAWRDPWGSILTLLEDHLHPAEASRASRQLFEAKIGGCETTLHRRGYVFSSQEPLETHAARKQVLSMLEFCN